MVFFWVQTNCCRQRIAVIDTLKCRRRWRSSGNCSIVSIRLRISDQQHFVDRLYDGANHPAQTVQFSAIVHSALQTSDRAAGLQRPSGIIRRRLSLTPQALRQADGCRCAAQISVIGLRRSAPPGSIPPLPRTASPSLPDASRRRYDFVIAFRNAFGGLLSRRQRCTATTEVFEINAGTSETGNWHDAALSLNCRSRPPADHHMARRLR